MKKCKYYRNVRLSNETKDSSNNTRGAPVGMCDAEHDECRCKGDMKRCDFDLEKTLSHGQPRKPVRIRRR